MGFTIKELSNKLKENDYDLTSLSDEENELFNRVTDIKNHQGKLARHFKGKFYLILDFVEHTETMEELVIYGYSDY